MRPRTEQQRKALEELRQRHPDRPCYIDSLSGVPVVGATTDELREMSEALGNEGAEEARRLATPQAALDFVRECNGDLSPDLAADLILGERVEAVEEVLATKASYRMRGSTSGVLARIKTAGGRRLLVHASFFQDHGSRMEPPESEADVAQVAEERAAELRAEWGGGKPRETS
jgi:hypothetical protein